MNNFLSYCGLVDVRINASDKDLPVKQSFFVEIWVEGRNFRRTIVLLYNRKKVDALARLKLKHKTQEKTRLVTDTY